MGTLFIFIDESGGFDFSSKGTKYFSLSATSTLDPLGKEELEKIKYDLIKKGINIEYFHASEDDQFVRNRIYNFIEELKNIEIDSVIVQKNKTNPSLISDKKKKSKKGKGSELYSMVLRTLLKYIFYRYRDSININQVVIILSSIFNKSKQELIKKTIKIYLEQEFLKPFFLYFHQCKADKNTQITDYCCWAIHKKWEDGEMRPYSAIQDKIRSEFDIFEIGRKTYYEYNT
ncbi:hypothetical protein ES695_15015 [Candidatus Atribacteria bacterium 1244-E10-H5-B2]|nr:MAG: hypothetical protein ES695_15015 [Candidatus Atribacteria bacterium 1244-E10-H5-B2]